VSKTAYLRLIFGSFVFAVCGATIGGAGAVPLRSPRPPAPPLRFEVPTATVLTSRPATANVVAHHAVDARFVPAIRPGEAATGGRRIQPIRGIPPQEYLARQLAAERNFAAPRGAHPLSVWPLVTPGLTANFAGMADSKTVCPPSGCEPPDMAVAASSQWVFQGVNTAYAVYDTTGTLQAGWPKNAQKFFGVPKYCNKYAPFLSDPRAFYDPNDNRFWAFILQTDSRRGCPFTQYYWVAVSQTPNPNGVWNVYAFDMTAGVTGTSEDFVQAGFDSRAMYISSNMFPNLGPIYGEIFGASKATMEAGAALTAAHGFFHLAANGKMVDTVQPVLTDVPNASGPPVEFFVNSYNANFPCFTKCSGVDVWAMAGGDTASPSLTGVAVPSANYVFPPLAGNPGCAHPCIDASDNRISGTPVYSNGLVSFAFETGVNNGTKVVPGIYWLQVQPALSGTTLTGGALAQSGQVFFTGDETASYGALVSDSSGNLVMVFDAMSKTIPPGTLYAARRPGDPAGTFEAALTLKAGLRGTTNRRWGDYEAASIDGAGNLWISSQFSGSTGDWATEIGATHF
jgi:hypothetical protein